MKYIYNRHCQPIFPYDGELRKINLEGKLLMFANLGASNLEGANLQEVRLQGAMLMYANFKGANLEGANLEGANLESSNLLGANLLGISFKDVRLTGAIVGDDEKKYIIY